MRHIGTVTKAPAAADEYYDQYAGYGIFSLFPAFWSSVLPGGPFQELGDLVGKWEAKIVGIAD